MDSNSNSDLRQLGTGLFWDITPSLLQMSGIPKTFCLSSQGIGPEIKSWLLGNV